MEFFVWIILSILSSLWMLLNYGFVALSMIAYNQGPGQQDTTSTIIGITVLIAALIPVLATSLILIGYFGKKPLGIVTKVFGSTAILFTGSLGLFFVLSDSSGTLFTGLTALLLAGSLSMSIFKFPEKTLARP